MQIVQSPYATRVLGEAQGFRPLPVFDINTADGPIMMTYWKPSADEIQELRNGACIVLSVMGTGHPPVLIETGTPPKDLPS